MTDRKPVGRHQLQTSAGRLDDGRHDSGVGHRNDRGAETYAEYAQQTCMASRQRLKLIAQGLRERLRRSARDSRSLVRNGLRQIGAQAGLAASRKLYRLAERIERKAAAIRVKSS